MLPDQIGLDEAWTQKVSNDLVRELARQMRPRGDQLQGDGSLPITYLTRSKLLWAIGARTLAPESIIEPTGTPFMFYMDEDGILRRAYAPDGPTTGGNQFLIVDYANLDGSGLTLAHQATFPATGVDSAGINVSIPAGKGVRVWASDAAGLGGNVLQFDLGVTLQFAADFRAP